MSAPAFSKVLQKAMQPTSSATQEDVLAGLLREARGETPGTSSAARVQAWRLIGEHLGMWTPERDPHRKSGLEQLVEHMAARRAERNRERGLE